MKMRKFSHSLEVALKIEFAQHSLEKAEFSLSVEFILVDLLSIKQTEVFFPSLDDCRFWKKVLM